MNENEEEHFFRKIYANFNLNFRYFKADFIEKALSHFHNIFEVKDTARDKKTLKDEIQQLTSDISALKDDVSSLKSQAARNQETTQDFYAKIIEINTVVDTKNLAPDKKKTPKKWSMLSSDNYKNLDEIILNPTYNN